MNLTQVGLLLQLLSGIILGLNYVVPDTWLMKANKILASLLSAPSQRSSFSPLVTLPLLIIIFAWIVIAKIFDVTGKGVLWTPFMYSPFAAIVWVIYLIILITLREMLSVKVSYERYYPTVVKALSISLIFIGAVALAIGWLFLSTNTFWKDLGIGCLVAGGLAPSIALLAQILKAFTVLPKGALGGLGVLLFLGGSIIVITAVG